MLRSLSDSSVRFIDIEAKDFDGDQKIDLLVLAQGSTDRVYLFSGTGTSFNPPSMIDLGLSAKASSLTIAQANLDPNAGGDQHPDLIVTLPEMSTEDEFRVLLNDGSGGIAQTIVHGLGDALKNPSDALASINLVDQNGNPVGTSTEDTFPDLILSYEGTDEIAVWAGRGDGTYRRESEPGKGAFPIQATFLQDPVAPLLPHRLASGDVDGDGDEDVVVGNFAMIGTPVIGGNGIVSYLINDFTDSSGANFFLEVSPGDFSRDLVTLGEITAVAAPDLDGNGRADIVATSPDEHVLFTALNNGNPPGSPTFFGVSGTSTFPAGQKASGLIVGDFDTSNPLPEVVVTNEGASQDECGIDQTETMNLVSLVQAPDASERNGSILAFSDITATLPPGAQNATTNEPAGAVVADLNGDGLDDIYLPLAPGTDNLILINTTAPGQPPSFQTACDFFSSQSFCMLPQVARATAKDQSSTGAVAADFDNDGDLDLYVIGSPSRSMSMPVGTPGNSTPVVQDSSEKGEPLPHRLVVDRSSWLPSMLVFPGSGDRWLFEDHRPVGGIHMPHSLTQEMAAMTHRYRAETSSPGETEVDFSLELAAGSGKGTRFDPEAPPVIESLRTEFGLLDGSRVDRRGALGVVPPGYGGSLYLRRSGAPEERRAAASGSNLGIWIELKGFCGPRRGTRAEARRADDRESHLYRAPLGQPGSWRLRADRDRWL